MSDKSLLSSAVEIAAKATGLRPDQVERAVEEYRSAIRETDEEPEWRAVMHMSLRDGGGFHQYADPTGNTGVYLQIETDKKSQDKVYVFQGKGYETFNEARAIELEKTSRPKPYEVPSK